MMHEQPGLDFHDSKSAHAELERTRARRELIGWLRAQAADRSGSAFWYVVRTRGDSAELVAEQMENHGIRAWCPMRKAVKRLPRRQAKTTIETALFPRYLFVRLPDFEAAFLGVMTFKRVDCLLGTASGPTPLGDEIIEEFQQHATEIGIDKSRLLKVGDLARVLSGPFARRVAEVREAEDDQAALDVEIQIFGRMTPCRIRVDDLEKLD